MDNSQFKKFDKWLFPNNETHLPEWMRSKNQRVNGRLTYQYNKYEEAKKHIKNFGLAVDIGAHIGLWSYFMAHDFERLEAFEPMFLHRTCWINNMYGIENAKIHHYALGEDEGFCGVQNWTEGSSGDTGVVVGNNIPMRTLDSFNLKPDFIKIDCEGYELNVLKGAEKTILEYKPVIIVEQKRDMAERYGNEKLGAVKFLNKRGYKIVREISGDFIMVSKWA